MTKITGFILFIFAMGSLSAQSFSKQLTVQSNSAAFNSDSLKILAVMVDFQEDKYDATVGTGKFGSHFSKNYGDTILDPLPHNAEYFSDHLLFAKNYFKKVSNGKLNIGYKVLPQVVTVSKMMREYSPVYQSKDLTPLGKFAEEVWKIADEKFTGVKFSDYNLFIIFHAGVSTGLDLGTFSIDRNLPSLFISTDALKNIFGNSFNGFPFKSGIVNNSLIMPETESREQTMIDNSVSLVEVSINGSLVANIASYLGLPDLFNTETGLSAIGRFGLMDGQAIGASYGMFPPEPSPWEKMYLDWETPKVIPKNTTNISISTRATAKAADTTLVKIPINSREYFLIENRSQDANKDKVKITYKRSGQIYTKIIEPDTSGFYFITPHDISGGVVIDVDEFDASLPGNGIVIWHVDENIISSKIAENNINSDLKNRGVYVAEADGIQDVGQVFNSIFGQVVADGDIYDFWYKGNKAKFYKNRFAPDSKPNTNSNSGANSLITLDNFSSLSNKMSFNVSFESNNIKLISSFNLPLASKGKHDLIVLSGNDGQNYFVTDGNDLLKFSSEGKLLKQIPDFCDSNKVAGIVRRGVQYIVGYCKNKINIYSKSNSTNQEDGIITIVPYNSNISTPLTLFYGLSDEDPFMIFGTREGRGSVGRILDFILDPKYGFSYEPGFTLKDPTVQICRPFMKSDGYYSVITYNELFESTRSAANISDGHLRSALIKDKTGNHINVILSKDQNGKRFDIVKNGKLEKTFRIESKNTKAEFSVAELFGDGVPFILNNSGSAIQIFNLNGSMLGNFPVSVPVDKTFYGAPLVIDFNKDNISEIIISSTDGEVFAFTPSTGKLIEGFPIKIGNGILNDLVLYSEELPTMGPLPTYKPHLAALDNQNKLTVVNLSPVQGKVYWNSEFGSFSNNSSIEISNEIKPVTDFFPPEKAYNWPNPVYGNSTNIRYYVSENSTVNIKIFDLSGWKVDELNDVAIGGFDNEINWDVSKIQSGVYYANLEVTGESGKSSRKIIKIAVIK